MNTDNQKKYAASPDKGSFRKECDERAYKKGEIDKETYERLIAFYDKHYKDEVQQENNLEWDLRGSDYIVNKCKNSKSYSQNIYAALCNNDFINKNKQKYSCGWRHAGSIVADLNEKGDYINWYCSGIGSGESDDEGNLIKPGYVSEGTITEEVKEDFLKLGWSVLKSESYNE